MKEVFLPAIRVGALLLLLTGCATVGAPGKSEELPADEGGQPAVEPLGEEGVPSGEPSAEAVAVGDGMEPAPVELPPEDDIGIPDMAGRAPVAEAALPVGAGWEQYGIARDAADWSGAEQQLRQIIAANPGDARAYHELALVLVRFSRLDAATDAARKAFELDKSMVASARLAVALLGRQNRLDEADGIADAAAAVDARNIDLQNLKVDVLIARKEYLRAIELARSLLKQDEVNVSVMKSLARAYLMMGKEKTAQYVYKRALELAPEDVEIVYFLAVAADRTVQDRAKVLAAFGKVVALKRDSPEALNNMGMIFYKTRNYEQAAQHFGEAVKYAPEFLEARLNLANALRGLNQFAEADKVLSDLADSHPDFAAAYFNRGLLYWENEFGGLSQEERILKAVELLRKYKDVAGQSLGADDPADRYIKEALDYVDSLRKAKDEEVRLKAEAEAKLGRLKPEAETEIRSMEELRARLVKGMEVWQTAGNVEKVNAFQALITDFDDGLGGMVTELKNAVANNSAEDVEYFLGELRNSAGDFQTRVDEIFAEPPPETAPEATPETTPEGGTEPTPEPAAEPVVEPVVEPAPESGSPIDYPTAEPVPPEDTAPQDASPLTPDDAAPLEPEG
jgi:tetratricopeptide (TPR) repeat protein